MTLAEFTVFEELGSRRPPTRLQRIRDHLQSIPKCVSKPLLTILTPNIIVFGVFMGFLVLGHYFKYANPYKDYHDPPAGTYFAFTFAYLIPVVSLGSNVCALLNVAYYPSRVEGQDVSESSDDVKEREISCNGLLILVFLWLVVVVGMLTDGSSVNLFGFQRII